MPLSAKFPNASVDDPVTLALALEAAVLLLRGGVHTGDRRFLGGDPFELLSWLERRLRAMRGGPTLERMLHMLDLDDPSDELDDARRYRRRMRDLLQRIEQHLDKKYG